MSEDDKGFLERWSRRKRANAGARPEEFEAEAEPLAGDEPAAPEPEEADPKLLASLPKLEDIDAGTDLRLFMQKGVPETLRQAALRRVWVADPMIRDFIEMADYAWDFNDPNGVPGFGPLLSTDDAGKLLAQIMGPAERPKPPEMPEADPEIDDAVPNTRQPKGPPVSVLRTDPPSPGGEGSGTVAMSEKEPPSREERDDPSPPGEGGSARQGRDGWALPLSGLVGEGASYAIAAPAPENVKPEPAASRRRHGGAIPR